MARYVEVPAQAIRERLTAAGFFHWPTPYKEEVWIRRHDKDPHYVLFVYTTIPQGGDSARKCGADAIRVVARKDEKVMDPRPPHIRSFFVHGPPKVLRTGSVEKVLDRMIERCREAYQKCSEHRRKRWETMK